MSHNINMAIELYKQAAIERQTAEHLNKVAIAAYFNAEHRGFNDSDPVADWLAAETEINARTDQ